MTKFRDLKTRTITGMAFVILTIFVAYLSVDVFIPYMALLTAICAYEWGRISNLSRSTATLYSVIIIGIVALNDYIIYEIYAYILPFVLLLSWRYKQLYVLAGLLYIPFFMLSVLSLTAIPNDSIQWWLPVLVLWGGVIVTDISAYFVGRFLGKYKLAPSVSPGKTWEGFFGGIVFTGLFYGIVDYYCIGYSVLHATITGCFLAGVAQLGDLYQSKMKRIAGVKDSGKILPGHGGMFDRLDGVIAVFVFIGLLQSYWSALA